MIAVVKTRINAITALVLAKDGECPDCYEVPICTVALCFPEALLQLLQCDIYLRRLRIK